MEYNLPVDRGLQLYSINTASGLLLSRIIYSRHSVTHLCCILIVILDRAVAANIVMSEDV